MRDSLLIEDKALEKRLKKYFGKRDEEYKSPILVAGGPRDRASWYHSIVLSNKHHTLLFRFLLRLEKPVYYPDISIYKNIWYRDGRKTWLEQEGKFYKINKGDLHILASECFARGANYAREEIEVMYLSGKVKTIAEYLEIEKKAIRGAKFVGKKVLPENLDLYLIIKQRLADPRRKVNKAGTIAYLCRTHPKFQGRNPRTLRNSYDFWDK